MNVRTAVEVALDADTELGEGPTWDDEREQLVWVDIERHLVHLFDPATGSDRAFNVGRPVGAAVPRKGGGLILALSDGFGALDEKQGTVALIAQVEADDEGSRMNDGKCDPQGRFWAGTLTYRSAAGAASLYRLDPGAGTKKIISGLTESNGMGWSPDGTLMYLIDTPTGGVDVFDFEAGAGTLSGRRRLVTVPSEAGYPDGMTVDAEGHLWVAIWGGSSVRRYSPQGELEEVVRLPTSHVTSCAFGGEYLEDLYVTSAKSELPEERRVAEPLAGALFRLRPGSKGLTHEQV